VKGRGSIKLKGRRAGLQQSDRSAAPGSRRRVAARRPCADRRLPPSAYL